MPRFIPAVAGFSAALAGCMGNVSELESGQYLLSNAYQDGIEDAYTDIEGTEMTLDVDEGTLTLWIGDEEISRNIEFLPKSDWPEGCPTNFSTSSMETAAIDGGTIVAGALTFEAPLVSAECGGGQPNTAIHEDGTGNSQGSSCSSEGPCLTFYQP